MATAQTTSRLIRALLILAIFTTSFDIFLVWRLGFTFRAAQIFLAIPIGYVLLQTIRNPVTRWPLGFTYLLAWLFFLALFIPNTDFPPRSVGYWLWQAFNTVLVFVIVQLLDNYRKVLAMLRWYLYSFLFVATFGIFQFFAPRFGLGAPLIVEWWVKDSLPRVNGFSYEPSYFATYLIMGWVLALYLLKHRATFIGRQRLWLIAAAITLALILSSSRSGILAMAIWLAQYPALLLRRLLQGFLNKKLLAINASLILALLTLAVTVTVLGVGKIEFLFAGIGLLGQAAHSVSTRANELRDTLEIFYQSPLIGYSLGGISSAIGQLRGINVTALEIAKQHEGMSIFAEALAASGIIGIIPLGMYIFGIIRAPMALSRQTHDANLKIILTGMGYALIIELIILQFNQNILRQYLWMHIALLSAAYTVAKRGARGHLPPTLARRPTGEAPPPTAPAEERQCA